MSPEYHGRATDVGPQPPPEIPPVEVSPDCQMERGFPGKVDFYPLPCDAFPV